MGTSGRILRVALACFAILGMAAHGAATGSSRPATTSRATTAPRVITAAATPLPAKTAAPSVKRSPATQHRRAAARPAPDPRKVPFAIVVGVALFHPATRVERVGFHQAS